LCDNETLRRLLPARSFDLASDVMNTRKEAGAAFVTQT
jgi:hypothetical protein